MLIGNGGKAVYYGPIGTECKTVTDYFARNGATPCPPGQNPAEYILDAGNGLRDAQGISSIKWPETWKASPEYAAVMATIDKTVQSMVSDSQDEAEGREYALTTAQQIPIVSHYTFLSYYRDIGYNWGRIVLAIMQAVIAGFTFFQMPNTASGAVLQMFALFSFTTFAIPFIITVIAPFNDRRAYFYRDSASGMYNWFSFSVSIMLSDLPYAMLPATIFFLIVYWLYGLQMAHLAPLICWAGILVYHQWANSFGQSVAALLPNAELASLVVSLATTILPAISGVPVPYSVMPRFWYYTLYWVNPYRFVGLPCSFVYRASLLTPSCALQTDGPARSLSSTNFTIFLSLAPRPITKSSTLHRL